MSERVTEHVLLSALTQQRFLARLEQRAESFDRDALSDVWRAAREAAMRLEEREAGCADDAAVLPIPAEMAAHIDAVVGLPAIDGAFSRVPVLFGLIELDSTMASRAVLVDERLEAMKAAWGTLPDDPALAAACLPLESEPFASPRVSFDGRCLSILDEDERFQQIELSVETGSAALEFEGPGEVHAALRLLVGVPPPVMHAVRLNDRLLLVDGHHRARILRAAGATFLPCFVSVCADYDDVLMAAPALGDLDLDSLFEAPRPPMLRDFGRASLVHSYRARRPGRLLQWRIEASAHPLP